MARTAGSSRAGSPGKQQPAGTPDTASDTAASQPIASQPDPPSSVAASNEHSKVRFSIELEIEVAVRIVAHSLAPVLDATPKPAVTTVAPGGMLDALRAEFRSSSPAPTSSPPDEFGIPADVWSHSNPTDDIEVRPYNATWQWLDDQPTSMKKRSLDAVSEDAVKLGILTRSGPLQDYILARKR